MGQSTEHSAPPARPRSRLPRAAARLAAVALGAVFLIPALVGLDQMQTRVPEGCFEFCDPQGGGRLLIALAVVGFLLAAAIWRKFLVALALGLCLSVLSTVVLGAFVAGLAKSGELFRDPAGYATLVEIWSGSALATLFLVIALREEVADAGRREGSPSDGR
ncbi:MAG TPA: hypothetical protein VHM48_11765 [Candidatus Limnocylindrales bacterium]|nr:hypothetical protein [Candidatus Limnocylindrales bacterium]